MAVHIVTNETKYICLSTDAKPSPIGAGATLHETDTGKPYVWTGAAWVEDLRYQYAKAVT